MSLGFGVVEQHLDAGGSEVVQEVWHSHLAQQIQVVGVAKEVADADTSTTHGLRKSAQQDQVGMRCEEAGIGLGSIFEIGFVGDKQGVWMLGQQLFQDGLRQGVADWIVGRGKDDHRAPIKRGQLGDIIFQVGVEFPGRVGDPFVLAL